MASTARVTGTYGNVIRGGVFAAVEVSLIVSGVAGTSRDAKGIDQVIRTLSHAYGTWVLALVAPASSPFPSAACWRAATGRSEGLQGAGHGRGGGGGGHGRRGPDWRHPASRPTHGRQSGAGPGPGPAPSRQDE